MGESLKTPGERMQEALRYHGEIAVRTPPWESYSDEGKAIWERAAEAFLASIPAAAPPGWKLLPEEPTEEMIEAYCQKLHSLGFMAWVNASVVYETLLAAAPTPPPGDAVEKLVERAVYIAAGAHNGQIDKGGSPYIQHPLRVMAAMETPEEKIVAVLHDVLEDCPDWDAERLAGEGFPKNIIDAVKALTRGEDEGYQAFIRRVAANPIARRVKLADLADNMDLSRIPNPGPSDTIRMQRYERAVSALSPLDGGGHG